MGDMKDSRKIPNLKVIIPRVKKESLDGVSIVFSGMVSSGEQLQKTKPYLVARSLGADVTEKITYQTTHLIAARPGTVKVNEARKRAKNIHLVTPDWLWCCAERWERIDERLYPLCKSVPITLKPPAHCSSPEDNAIDRTGDFEIETLDPAENSNRNGHYANTLYKLSSDVVKGMEQEVDEILSSENSSDSTGDETMPGLMARKHIPLKKKRPVNEPPPKCARSAKRKLSSDNYFEIAEEELGSVVENMSSDSDAQQMQSDLEPEKDASDEDELEKAMAMQVEREFMGDESQSD